MILHDYIKRSVSFDTLLFTLKGTSNAAASITGIERRCAGEGLYVW